MTDFQTWPDLAVRTLGGSVVAANDELFAQRENLINAAPPVFEPSTFGHKGKVYDGWETRRRREPGHDAAVVRLGVPGVVHGVVVDTAWFRGNYPPQASVEGLCVLGYPSAGDLTDHPGWETIVPRSDLAGDAQNAFAVDSDRRWTHVRLSIYPDGGVARLRVHGEPVPDPRLLDVGAIDLAATENGGRVVGCSDMFFGSPANLIAPGLARSMGEGWETARRRDDGNDWVQVGLAGAGTVRLAELDTSYFVGNAPGWARITGADATAGDLADPTAWREMLPRTPLQPDTHHRFVLGEAPAVTHVRLDVYPDGGMARLRLLGSLSPAAREALGLRWFTGLSEASATQVLADAGVDDEQARELAARRPIVVDDLPASARVVVTGAAA